MATSEATASLCEALGRRGGERIERNFSPAAIASILDGFTSTFGSRSVTGPPPGQGRVLVTGVSGNIGASLAPGLAALGWQVEGAARSGGEFGSIESLRSAMPSVTVHQGDLRDEQVARQLCPDVDAIVHLAGASGVEESFVDPLANLEGNVLPFHRVLEACKPGARVILVSSQLVYRSYSEVPLVEEDELTPQSPYAAHRRLLEDYARIWASRRRLDTQVLRLANVFGPIADLLAPRTHGLVARILADLQRHGVARVYGDGAQRITLLHVSDLTRAVAAVLAEPSRESITAIYNLGGTALPLRRVVDLLIKGLGAGEIVDTPWPTAASTAMARGIALDDTRFRRRFHWQPRLDVEAELTQLANHFRKLPSEAP